MGDWFAWLITGLEFVAGIAYAVNGDWPRAAYWGFASILCASTIFMK